MTFLSRRKELDEEKLSREKNARLLKRKAERRADQEISEYFSKTIGPPPYYDSGDPTTVRQPERADKPRTFTSQSSPTKLGKGRHLDKPPSSNRGSSRGFSKQKIREHVEASTQLDVIACSSPLHRSITSLRRPTSHQERRHWASTMHHSTDQVTNVPYSAREGRPGSVLSNKSLEVLTQERLFANVGNDAYIGHAHIDNQPLYSLEDLKDLAHIDSLKVTDRDDTRNILKPEVIEKRMARQQAAQPQRQAEQPDSGIPSVAHLREPAHKISGPSLPQLQLSCETPSSRSLRFVSDLRFNSRQESPLLQTLSPTHRYLDLLHIRRKSKDVVIHQQVSQSTRSCDPHLPTADVPPTLSAQNRCHILDSRLPGRLDQALENDLYPLAPNDLLLDEYVCPYPDGRLSDDLPVSLPQQREMEESGYIAHAADSSQAAPKPSLKFINDVSRFPFEINMEPNPIDYNLHGGSQTPFLPATLQKCGPSTHDIRQQRQQLLLSAKTQDDARENAPSDFWYPKLLF